MEQDSLAVVYHEDDVREAAMFLIGIRDDECVPIGLTRHERELLDIAIYGLSRMPSAREVA